MIGFLWRLIVGHFTQCNHNWETIDEGIVRGNGVEIGRLYVLKCKNCGDMKQFNTESI